MAVVFPGRSRFSSLSIPEDEVLRALRVEVLSIDPGSPFLRATFSLVEASPAADGLGMMFRVVSPVLRDNVSLRASIRFPQGRPAARLRACILPVGAPFDVVTKEDLDWLTLQGLKRESRTY